MSSASTTADLRAFVANCLIGGDGTTTYGDKWIRDRVEIQCGNFTLLFRQAPKIITTTDFDQFNGRFVETTEILVKSVTPEQVDEVLQVVTRVCWLLSFACLSHVVYYRHEYPDGSGLGCKESCRGVTSHFCPSLGIRDGSAVKSFVEQTYDKYCQLEQSRKLNVVIDYLVQAELPDQPTELKLVLAFVILENLKHTFAHSKNIPFIEGFFRRPPYPATKKNGTCPFQELLEDMLSKINMRHKLYPVVQLRNEIIHSGLSELDDEQQISMYGEIHDLIREYLFRLLGYHGSIPTYSSKGCEFITI